MNAWFKNPLSKQAQAEAMAAEDAEQRGDLVDARAHYRQAGELFGQVALRVSADYPNTRSDMGIASVVCLGRAGMPAEAVAMAGRLLAERGALTTGAATELTELFQEFTTLAGKRHLPTRRAAANPSRDAVRKRFVLKDAA